VVGHEPARAFFADIDFFASVYVRVVAFVQAAFAHGAAVCRVCLLYKGAPLARANVVPVLCPAFAALPRVINFGVAVSFLFFSFRLGGAMRRHGRRSRFGRSLRWGCRGGVALGFVAQVDEVFGLDRVVKVACDTASRQPSRAPDERVDGQRSVRAPRVGGTKKKKKLEDDAKILC